MNPTTNFFGSAPVRRYKITLASIQGVAAARPCPPWSSASGVQPVHLQKEKEKHIVRMNLWEEFRQRVSSKGKGDSLERWAAVLWDGGNHGSLAYLKNECLPTRKGPHM